MPRLRAKPVVSLSSGRWDALTDAPARLAAVAPTPLEARSDRETAVATGQEVGRVQFVPWRRHAGGGWYWCILQGERASGYAGSREGALEALARSWREQKT